MNRRKGELGRCWSKDTKFSYTGGVNSRDLLKNIVTIVNKKACGVAQALSACLASIRL
jgi:hypothetical protein